MVAVERHCLFAAYKARMFANSFNYCITPTACTAEWTWWSTTASLQHRIVNNPSRAILFHTIIYAFKTPCLAQYYYIRPIIISMPIVSSWLHKLAVLHHLAACGRLKAKIRITVDSPDTLIINSICCLINSITCRRPSWQHTCVTCEAYYKASRQPCTTHTIKKAEHSSNSTSAQFTSASGLLLNLTPAISRLWRASDVTESSAWVW